MTFHPVANMLPLLQGEAFDDLVSDIKTNGQRHAILKAGNQIIDGRNRYRACQKLGIKPVFEEWDGKGSLVEISCGLNIKRRQIISISQRAAAGALAEIEFAKEAKDRQRKAGGAVPSQLPESVKGDARDFAARACGVSATYITAAKKIRLESPGLFKQIQNGETTLAKAKRSLCRQEKTRRIEAVNLPAPDPKNCQIIKGDCVGQLESLPWNSVRLIFADSPYNIGIDYAGKGPKADLKPDADFLGKAKQWIGECARVLTPDGSMFVMMNSKYTDRIGVILADAGLHRRNIIIWHEEFGTHASDNFAPCARFIHYYTKDAKSFVFNSDAARSNGASLRVKSRRQTVYKDKRADASGKVPSNVWDIPRLVDNAAERMPGFPTQIPLELVERIILFCSEPGDLVIDPFTGSGTTAVAAVTNGRRFVGFDLEEKYVKAATARVSRAIAEMNKGN